MSQLDFQYSHQIFYERCKGRLDCIRACPTRALRYRNNKIVFLKNFCINCGICLQICKEKVFVPDLDALEDSRAFEFQIVIPSPVLYTQFHENVHPLVIRKALRRIGFDEVVDQSRMNDEMNYALHHHLMESEGPRPLIGIHCPAVLRFIQVRYPNLVENIVPFEVPHELTAREVKREYSRKLGLSMDKIGITYISQCLARAVSIKKPVGSDKSWFDVIISIKDAYNVLLPEIIEIQKSKEPLLDEEFYFGRDFGFFSHITLFEDHEKCLYITGLDNIERILDDIESARLRNIQYIEALACLQGCVNGVFCVENLYIAGHNSAQLLKKFGSFILTRKEIDVDKIKERYRSGYYFLERPVLPRSTRQEGQDISMSIKRLRQKERIFSKLPQKNCGLCGSPDCKTFAEDCAYGEADIADCIFFKMNMKGTDR